MRKVLLALTLLLGSTSPALAQTGAWAEKIFKGPLTYDFGSVPRGGKVVYQFPVSNIYAVPLEFTGVRSTCGCMTAEAKPRTLKPQESGVIEIAVDTTRFSGHFSKNVHVTVGPQYVSTATLTVTCIARADVVLNPGQFNFGAVPQGKKMIQTLDVEYAGALDWQVTKVTKSPTAPIDVSIEQLYRTPPSGASAGKVGYRLAVTLKDNAPAGTLHQELHLETNDPTSRVMSVTVDANIQATLSASQSVVALSAKAGQTTTHKIQIRGNRPFRILSVDGAGDGVTADLPLQAAANHIVTVRLLATQPGTVRKALTFRTDLDGGSVVVTVDATVSP